MNKKNQNLKKLILLVTTGILGGCFETPSSPTSQRDAQPLNQKTTAPFTLPDGVTEIHSAFSQTNSEDWGNAQNWTSRFYKDGKIIEHDLSHKFVPCRGAKPQLPTRITIHTGTCLVNESVEISGLDMSSKSRMTIPEGITVTNLGDVHSSGDEGIIIDGGGDFYVAGESHGWRANAKLNKLHAPKVRWGAENAFFDVNQAELYSLTAHKIIVNDRMNVGSIYLDETKDLSINHLHITKGYKSSVLGNLFLGKSSRPLNIECLSFDPGTVIQLGYGAWHSDMDAADAASTRLAGTLDVTNMNIFNSIPFINNGIIGEKVPIIIADKGIKGDMSFLKKYRRRLVSGCWGTSEEHQQDGLLPSKTLHLVWVDGNTVYWQRMSNPLLGGSEFILHNDAEVTQWYRDNFNQSVTGFLNISELELEKMRQICKAIVSQGKYIYDHASEAGIERFLDIQITPKAADRVRKLLALVDIQPYLNDRNELSEPGMHAVVDAICHLNLNAPKYPGVSVLNNAYSVLTTSHHGVAIHGAQSSLSGAFHQAVRPNSPWVMGVEYQRHLTSGLWGVLRTLGEGRAMNHALTLNAKCGLGYALSPLSQLTVLAGGNGLFGNELSCYKGNSACPMSAVWTLETGIEWAMHLGAHELRVGGDIAYRPTQSLSVRIPDLAVTVDEVSVAAGWNMTGRFGYAYESSRGVRWMGNLSFKIGETQSTSGTIGIQIDR